MRIFSSAEYLRRVRRFTYFMCCSALSDFLLIFNPSVSYDEPKIPLKQNQHNVSRWLNRYKIRLNLFFIYISNELDSPREARNHSHSIVPGGLDVMS